MHLITIYFLGNLSFFNKRKDNKCFTNIILVVLMCDELMTIAEVTEDSESIVQLFYNIVILTYRQIQKDSSLIF